MTILEAIQEGGRFRAENGETLEVDPRTIQITSPSGRSWRSVRSCSDEVEARLVPEVFARANWERTA